MRDPERLAEVTYGQLYAIPAMGATSIIDFATRVEEYLEAIEDLTSIPESLEEQPWVEMVSEEDPRFASLLPVGLGTVAQRLESATSVMPGEALAVTGLAGSLGRIQAEVNRIDRLNLESGVREIIGMLSRADGKRLEAILKRFGWGPEPAPTLDEAARLIGVTRERMRQIQKRITEKIPSHPVYLPVLDKVLDAVAAMAPIEVGAVSKCLVELQLTAIGFHPSNILNLATLFGRVPTFDIRRIKGTMIVVSEQGKAASGRIVTIAASRAASAGATNLSDVIQSAAAEGIETTEEQVKGLLSNLEGFTFLDSDWFWRSGGNWARNRLYNTARAVLSVAAPVDIGVMREGAKRKYRRIRYKTLVVVPPKGIMEAFFRGHPDFRCDAEGRVSTVRPLDYRRELGGAEQTVVEVLRTAPGGVLDRSGLTEACEKRGMNANTVSVVLTYSPVFDHIGTDIWGLRGASIEPAAVDALRRSNSLRPRERRVINHGWLADGRLSVGIRLNRGATGFVAQMPSAISRYVESRRFRAVTDDSMDAGVVVVNEIGSSWGYGPFLRRSGAEEGDMLIATFDLVEGQVCLSIGTEEGIEAS